MKSLASVFVAVAVLGAVAAAPASAERAATPAEKAAIAEVIGMAPGCIEARISTADESWAEMWATNEPACPGADGAVILHGNVADGYENVLEGSGFPWGLCPMEDVPTPVAIDLELCRDPLAATFILRGGRYVEQPSVLPLPRVGKYAYGELRQARWRGWGRATATATGSLRLINRNPLSGSIKVYGRKRCDTGRQIYTRARIKEQGHGYGKVLTLAKCSQAPPVS